MGFVDQLREQIDVIRDQQMDVTWVNYVHDRFQRDKSHSGRRRRSLVLALSLAEEPIPKNEIPRLTGELAAEYAQKTPKTVSRDLNALLDMRLIARTPDGYVASKDRILAFLPIRRRAGRRKTIISQPRRRLRKASGDEQLLLLF
jgi:hypothetical protein